MMAVTRNDPFQPVLGEDIGPTRVDRARSGVLLGIVAAVSFGVIALVAWTLLKTALG
jgi:hypothetical protein